MEMQWVKSIQGAGGSLILGSVFQSIIERTLLSPSLSEQSPEIWLKNAFIEMHKIFESFSGSMLVSIVIGLLDDSNGFIYYLNAEHPPSILFRDGKAHYIEEESFFRKLGTLQINTGIFIQTFQMLPGDTLLIGSDGRDDIRMMDESSIANINSNPNRILQVIEEENCDLPQIYKTLKTYGEITDDLSLLKIHFHKTESKPKEIHPDLIPILDKVEKHFQEKEQEEAVNFLISKTKEYPEDYELLKQLSILFARIDKYKFAVEKGIKYLEFVPSDTIFFYRLATYCKMAGEFSTGIEIAERLRLREPQNLNNLLNLVDLYSLSQNHRRAEELLKYYLKLDPSNPIALELIDAIKKRKLK
jgi:hypothetical protein